MAGRKGLYRRGCYYYFKFKYQSSYAIAVIYAGLGETDEALKWLEIACDERATWMIFLKVHPYFDNLRAEPRFQELLQRLQFP